MAVTILEALQNANMNISTAQSTGMHQLIGLAQEQLNNAVTLLSKGYDINDEVEPLLEEHGDVDLVPEA